MDDYTTVQSQGTSSSNQLTTLNADHMPSSPNDQHPLLTLPPEIRNEIYGYLFPWQRCNYFNPSLVFPIERGLNMCNCLHGTPLFRVCRQLRDETLPIFYNNHIIRLSLFQKDRRRVESWIKSIGDDAIAQMRKVHVRGFPSEAQSEGQACVTFASTSFLLIYPETEGKGGMVKCMHRSNVRGSRESAEKVRMAAEELADETREVLHALPRREVLTTEKIEKVFEIAGWT